MMATRYRTAAEFGKGRRTLELACASGPGLGLLAKDAPLTIGADINAAMLKRGQAHYCGRVPLVQMSAEALPFRDRSFDFVLMLEATYYVKDFDRALAEMDRVLAPRGRIMFVNANPERPDFIRSPFSHHYHSADEFRRALSARGYTVDVAGAFPIEDAGHESPLKSKLVSLARRILEALHLVPNTLEGRAKLKRLLGAKLRPVPPEIGASFAERAPLVPRTGGPIRDFKVIYVRAERGR